MLANGAAHGRIALPYSGTVSRLIPTAKLEWGSLGLSANSFKFYFTERSAQLFTFPSRYLFTIGLKIYLALEDGSPGFLRSVYIGVLGNSLRAPLDFVYKIFTFCD